MPDTSQHLRKHHPLPNERGAGTTDASRPLRTHLLPVESTSESFSRHNLMLSNSGYRLATAGTRSEVFDLLYLVVHLAILSDSLGSFSLRSMAEDISRQWPQARIPIIGAAQAVLDDPLYDEAVDRRIFQAELLTALIKLSAHTVGQGVQVFHLSSDSVDRPVPFERNRRVDPAESDPTKVPGYDTERKEVPHDLPTEERRESRTM